MGISVLWGIDLAIRSSTLCCSSTERYGECQSFPFAAQHTIERETTAIKQSTAVACNCIIQRHSANNNNNSNKNQKELKKKYLWKGIESNCLFSGSSAFSSRHSLPFFSVFFFSSFHCLSFGVPSIASETREMMCSFICIKKMANTKSICNNMSLRRLFFFSFLFVCLLLFIFMFCLHCLLYEIAWKLVGWFEIAIIIGEYVPAAKQCPSSCVSHIQQGAWGNTMDWEFFTFRWVLETGNLCAITWVIWVVFRTGLKMIVAEKKMNIGCVL